MKIQAATLALSAWILCAVAPLVAHHAFKSEFDTNKPMHLEGKVTQAEWMNPHVYLNIEVPEKNGTSNWRVELTSPNDLTRQGMTRLTIRTGIDVTVDGFAAKSGDRLVGAMAFTLKANGQGYDISESWKRFEVPARQK